jgi:hypothetical protein
MKLYKRTLVLISSVALVACVTNPSTLVELAANASSAGANNGGNATGSMLGALTAGRAASSLAGGQANPETNSLPDVQTATAIQSADPGPYAKNSCKSLQGEYRKLTPKAKKLGTAAANNVATAAAVAVNPHQIKMAQIESAAATRNCALTRGDGTKYVAASIPMESSVEHPAQTQEASNAPSSAMTALSVASNLTGNGGNLGSAGAGGGVGGALLGSFLGGKNQAPAPNAASLASIGNYATMDCKALQIAYDQANVKAAPAGGGMADKVAGGGAAIGLFGALTGNRELANMAQQATSVTKGAKSADGNLQQIQMAASTKGCRLS